MKTVEIIYPLPLVAAQRPAFVVAKKLFTPKQCEALIEFTESHGRYYQSGGLSDTRDVSIYYLYPDQLDWPFAKIGRAAMENNVWGFALSGFAHPMRIQKYRRNGFTDPHIDFEYEVNDPSKLTAVVPLVGRREWTGGQLKIGNHSLTPTIDKGDCVFFPGFYPHWVTSVQKGTRVILTGWLVGPDYV